MQNQLLCARLKLQSWVFSLWKGTAVSNKGTVEPAHFIVVHLSKRVYFLNPFPSARSFDNQFHCSIWKVWSKYMFIYFFLILILWKNWITILYSTSLCLSWLSCFHRVVSFISWGVSVCRVSPCWLSRWFLLVTFFCFFSQSTTFTRRWWESKLPVWKFFILFKRISNTLVPVWLASTWYCLSSINYNSKIFSLSGSSCFTAHP